MGMWLQQFYLMQYRFYLTGEVVYLLCSLRLFFDSISISMIIYMEDAERIAYD